MTKQVDYHDWTTITEGDVDYDSTFSNLIDDIDREALLIVNSLPNNNAQDRWIIRTTDYRLFYDDGSSFTEIDPERVLPDRIGARTDKDEVIGSSWSFENDVDADISRRAEYAQKADIAETAKNATLEFGGTPAERFCLSTEATTLSGKWTFSKTLKTDEINITGGTLEFPTYG